jgi:hypothetical protein
MRQIRENRVPYPCCSTRSREGPKTGPSMWNIQDNRGPQQCYSLRSRAETKERSHHMGRKKEQNPFSKLFNTIQRAYQRQGPSCEYRREYVPLLNVIPEVQGPSCGIYERIGSLSNLIPCGPGWEPKAVPSMRDILENRAPQQNVFHAVHGGNQKQGPPCGIEKRIGSLSNVDAWCNSTGIKDRALYASGPIPPESIE